MSANLIPLNRVIIIAPGSTIVQQNIVTQYFGHPETYAYWHWAPDVWLVSSFSDLDPIGLRETLRTLAPGIFVLVVRVEPGAMPSWAAFGPMKWGDWMKEWWDRRG